MEPETKQPTFTAQLHEVTPVSKYLAMALFIILPFIGGYVGYKYAPAKNVAIENPGSVQTEPEQNLALNEIYQVVFVSGGDYFPNQFLERNGELYIFHTYPFDAGVELVKINGVNKASDTTSFSFITIGSDYIKNDEYVIFTGSGSHEPTLVDGADPETFNLVMLETGRVLGVDDRSVYYHGESLENIDPTRMEFIFEPKGYQLPVVHDSDTYWFPVGDCHFGSYREGTAAELESYVFPC